MKQFILILIALSKICYSQSQSAKVSISEFVKHSKTSIVEGIFTVGDKRFMMTAEGAVYFAAIYPITDDNAIGEVIKQENVILSVAGMTCKKCLYIQWIIVNNDQTFLFYSKREGALATVYYVKLDEDCIIREEEAVEVMQLKLSHIAKNTDFVVRQSPDKSKILVGGMNRGSAKNCEFIFKVYSAKMGSLIWEKTFEAARTDKGTFGGGNRFSTINDFETLNNNNFLINNEGRAYFLSDWRNPSGKKHELTYVSIDQNGKTKTTAEVPFKGEYYVRQLFRLTPSGKANLILFYNTEKVPVEMTNMWGADVNAMSFQEYDGNKVNVKADYTLSEDDQSKFYPEKFRKNKSDFRIGGYDIARVMDLPNGDIAFLLHQTFSTVATERPFSNTAHGFTCVMITDSNYAIKKTQSYVSKNSYAWRRFYYKSNCNLMLINQKLHLFYIDESENIMVQIIDDTKNKGTNFGTSIKAQNAFVYLDLIIFRKDELFVPLGTKKNMYGLATVKL